MLPVIDLHCDTLSKLSSAPERFLLSRDTATSHIFYPGLCSAGTRLQCFAIFTDLCDTAYASPLSCVSEQYRCFRRLLSLTEGHMRQVRTSADLTECIRTHKIGALLTLEEGCLCKTPVSLLPKLFSIGVRIATLTWDYPTLLGTPANPSPPSYAAGSRGLSSSFLVQHPVNTGLTAAGIDFLSEAERLGILIDVSHLSDAGFRDVALHSKKPFLASHSNTRAVCPVPRNLSNEQLRCLGERGGLAGLTLHEPFITSVPVSVDDLPVALAHHAKHIISVAGSETPALGTDFDGISGNRAVPDITTLSRLEDAFLKAGLSSVQIEKIFYQNALRFFTEAL